MTNCGPKIKTAATAYTRLFSGFLSRHVDNNPWSCDQSTLHVLQMELTALVGEHSHLDNFDGGRIECYDPPHMKGKKPLHLSYRKKSLFTDHCNIHTVITIIN